MALSLGLPSLIILTDRSSPSPISMSPLQSFFLFSLFFLFLLFPQKARGASPDCSIYSCTNGPPVRFPFRLNRRLQSFGCGYPGFDLSCNNRTQLTTLTLPVSGAFLINHIEYKSQTLWIDDPDSCFTKRLISQSQPFSLDDTPFSLVVSSINYTFLNCSASQTTSTLPATATSIPCLSDARYTVYAVPSRTYFASAPAAAPSSSSSPESCLVITTALVPRGMTYEWEVNMGAEATRGGVALKWYQPDCSDCEARRKSCGLDTDTRQIICYESKKDHVLPRGAKYGIIIGVGIPGLLFIIATVNYIYSRIFGLRHQQSTDEPSTSTALQSASVVVGLDAPTIESYPKTLLGESRRLPRANDNICSICLGDYQPKEALRTIPECNHYFHANCIDEWLKLNATCPVCRNSPEGSSLVTPSSSVSSSTSSS